MSGELRRLARRFQDREPGLLGASRSYAVRCPLLEGEDGLRLLFEVRAPQLRQGGGEVRVRGEQAEHRRAGAGHGGG